MRDRSLLAIANYAFYDWITIVARMLNDRSSACNDIVDSAVKESTVAVYYTATIK